MSDQANPRPSSRRRSNLGRAFSFRYPNHRWVIVIATLTGALALGLALASGDPLTTALGRGFNGGAAAFVAWVLARELDPPRQWTGLLAAGLGGLASVLIGPLPILAGGFLILPLRLVNHAAGFRSNPGDSLAVALSGLLVMLLTSEWLLGAATALALALDGVLDSKQQGRQWAWAAVTALGTLLYLFVLGWPALSTPSAPEFGIAGLAILFSLLRLARRRDQGPDDRGRPVIFRRVALGVALACMIALASLFTGENGLSSYAVLWAALLGAGF